MADRASAAHERHDAELVPGCRDCGALAPDLAAISLALTSLRGGSQTGHRDFRITAQDAQRLRRGRGIRAWLRPVSGPRFAFARPLGGTLSVLALIGLVASSLPSGFAAGGALQVTGAESAPGREQLTDPPRANASPSADAAFDSLRGSPKAGQSDAAMVTSPELSTAPSQAASQATAPVPSGPVGPTAKTGVFVASLVLLPIGLLLVVGRGLARRLIGAGREP
ncbi:MAG TPA: hypothetical protein VFC71_07495 [Candidatus Polarisedimenticolia bacterium]|nr:hypothetical protein [Candidatus Polarisedimenticolia bacterium]